MTVKVNQDIWVTFSKFSEFILGDKQKAGDWISPAKMEFE